MINAAYLVEDAESAAFKHALARLAADGRHTAVEVSASGPWIPYSFARWDEAPDATEPDALTPDTTEPPPAAPERTAPDRAVPHPVKQEARS
ncbi:GvpL/GvpF family gas vesicle protein [Streptomyces sp. NPDC097107]|uniref:GvpL/GvpF family gas vesicle protein n=1 Tax=Streptomyces sp. NPDC097107 TaxID=3366089 RepID=UPI0038101FC5